MLCSVSCIQLLDKCTMSIDCLRVYTDLVGEECIEKDFE